MAALDLSSREAILREASRLFAARGIGSVTMRDIAGSAGVHLPSIYHFFENKHTLHRECVEWVFGRAGVQLSNALSEAGDHRSPIDRVEAFAAALCDTLRDDREFLAFACHASLDDDGWLPGSSLYGPFGRVVALIAQATGSDSASADAAAMRMLSMALGVALARRSWASANELSPREIVRLSAADLAR